MTRERESVCVCANRVGVLVRTVAKELNVVLWCPYFTILAWLTLVNLMDDARPEREAFRAVPDDGVGATAAAVEAFSV